MVLLLFLVPVCAGAIAGMARGGSLGNLARLRLRAGWVVAAALAVQVALRWLPRWSRVPLVLVTYVLVGAWTVVNVRHRPAALGVGFALVAAGWALNLLAIAPNGGMPVSAHALAQIGAPVRINVRDGNLSKHVAAGATSRVRWLGDTIPVRPVHSVISIGDIAMALGFALLVASAAGGHAENGGGAAGTPGAVGGDRTDRRGTTPLPPR